jgi:hypothetical protein
MSNYLQPYTANENEILGKYVSYSNINNAQLRILDKNGKVMKTIKVKIVFGDNYYKLSLGSKFKTKDTYRIQLLADGAIAGQALFIVNEDRDTK